MLCFMHSSGKNSLAETIPALAIAFTHRIRRVLVELGVVGIFVRILLDEFLNCVTKVRLKWDSRHLYVRG